MRDARVRSVAAFLFIAALPFTARIFGGLQAQERRRIGLEAVGGADLRAWDAQVDRMVRSGQL